MFCANCGAQFPDGANVCPNCGKPVAGVNAAPQGMPQMNPQGMPQMNPQGMPYMAPQAPKGSSAALALGIVSIVVSILGGIMFGLIGATIGLICGIIGLVLACASKKTGADNQGALVCSILGIVFALIFEIGCGIVAISTDSSQNKDVIEAWGKNPTCYNTGCVGCLPASCNTADTIGDVTNWY